MPDSEENDARFGRPKTHRGERSAFPQVRVVALAECGTHAITHATLGSFTTAESVLARELFDALGPGDLLMADRGFAGLEQWRAAAAGGADLLWRIKSDAVLPVRAELPDGVEQEVWGHLLVHHAIRQLMHTAAEDIGTDPDRLSFTRTLRLASRQVAAQAAFSPDRLAAAHPSEVPPFSSQRQHGSDRTAGSRRKQSGTEWQEQHGQKALPGRVQAGCDRARPALAAPERHRDPRSAPRRQVPGRHRGRTAGGPGHRGAAGGCR